MPVRPAGAHRTPRSGAAGACGRASMRCRVAAHEARTRRNDQSEGTHGTHPARAGHPAQTQGHLADDRAGAGQRRLDLQRLPDLPGSDPGDRDLHRPVARRRRRLRHGLPPADRHRAGQHGRGLRALARDGVRARADRGRARADLRRHEEPDRGAEGGGLRQHGRLRRRHLQPAAGLVHPRPAGRAVLDLSHLHRPAGADALPAGQGRCLHGGGDRLRHRAGHPDRRDLEPVHALARVRRHGGHGRRPERRRRDHQHPGRRGQDRHRQARGDGQEDGRSRQAHGRGAEVRRQRRPPARRWAR